MHTDELAPNTERFGATASRILVGAPARQPNLDRPRRKNDCGAAERSYILSWLYFKAPTIHIND